MADKIIVVYPDQTTRENANFLENDQYPFQVGHLINPQLLETAVSKVSPALVLFYVNNDDSTWAVEAAGNLRKRLKELSSLLVMVVKQGCNHCASTAIDAGMDAMIDSSQSETDLIARIGGLINSSAVSREYLRRSRSLARASAEAADIIVQLEEATRRIQEQNDELQLRDEQIMEQQKEIQTHLDTVKHELSLAASLQISLMPSGREYSRETDLQITDRYIPAADLGGDYYDYVRLPDGGLFVCIADVTGHGVAPSLVSVQVRALARSHLQSGQSMAAVMSDLNTFMYETFQQDYLMTMAGMVFRPGSKEIEFVGAGHCPIIHHNLTTGKCNEIFSKGLPLGVLCDTDYESSTVTMESDERFLLYTDGITEVNDANEVEFGPEKLVQLLGQSSNIHGPKMLQTILQEVGDYCEGKPFDDDVTMVLVEHN